MYILTSANPELFITPHNAGILAIGSLLQRVKKLCQGKVAYELYYGKFRLDC